MELVIAIALLVVALSAFSTVRLNWTKQEAYRWWFIPYAAILYGGLMFLLYKKIDIPNFLFFGSIPDDCIEVVFSMICMAIWVGISSVLKMDSICDSMLRFYRNIFERKSERKDEMLPFPYYWVKKSPDTEEKDESGKQENDKPNYEVKGRVGLIFYRWTMKTLIFSIVLIYAIYYVLMHFISGLDFYLTSGFPILALIPLFSFFEYLCCDVSVEKNIIEEPKHDEDGDMDKLWNLYVTKYDNYSVAWKKRIEAKKIGDSKINNKAKIEDALNLYQGEDKDLIVEDYDLVSAFGELIPFFMDTIKKGGNILVAIDIPKHFSSKRDISYLKMFAETLTEVLKKRYPKINEIIEFKVYDEAATGDVFKNRIVMAPVSLLSRQDLFDHGWMKDLGLLTVVNVFDKGVSDFFESRKFSFMLRQQNDWHQTIIISPYRHSIQSAVEQTWIMDVVPHEVKMERFPRAKKLFFIGYNFEEYLHRFNAAFRTLPNEQMYSGSEMAIPALSTLDGKVAIPIHYFDLAYSSSVEGKEEINKFGSYIQEQVFKVSSANLIDKMYQHVIPVEDVVEKKLLSVAYDTENNAPSIYLKWIHLGLNENFAIVISKPYLFRDYFNANHDYFVKTPFASLQPKLCNSRITLAIILCRLLQKGPATENELVGYLKRYYDDEVESVPQKLKSLFLDYLPNDLAEDLRVTVKTSFEQGKYQTNVEYTLENPESVNLQFLDMISVKDTSGHVIFEILRDLLFQNYVEGQIHSFFGRPYEIQHFDEINKTLNVRKANVSNQLFYRPCIDVSIQGDVNKWRKIRNFDYSPGLYYNHLGEPIPVSLIGYEGKVEVRTNAWISFTETYSAPKYASGKTYIINSADCRDYKNCKFLRFSIDYFKKDEYVANIDKIRKGLQLLFYEAFYSIYPHHAQYLIVSSSGCRKDDVIPWIFGNFCCEDNDSDKLTFYFIEDAHVDLGLIGALTWDYIQEVLIKTIFDYLSWLEETDGIPSGYDNYLQGQKQDKFAFLKYGGNELPDFFDVALLKNFIRDNFGISDKDLLKKQNDRIVKPENGACDFCGQEFKNEDMQQLDDGRMRCKGCSEGAVDSEAKFKELCEKAKNLFKTHLGIDFSSIPYEGKFVSAVELHKQGGYPFSVTNGYDIREAIGVAFDRKNDFFIVENGRKEPETLGVIIHEMTHIWQFNDSDFKKVKATDGLWVEGLAVWTDLFLSEKNGASNTEALRASWLARDDEYGHGLRMIIDKCNDDPYGYIRQLANGLK